MNNRVNKIQWDNRNKGCSCIYFESESGKKYITKECKECAKKSAIKKAQQKEIQDNYESERLKRKMDFQIALFNESVPPPTRLKLNWFQRIIYA